MVGKIRPKKILIIFISIGLLVIAGHAEDVGKSDKKIDRPGSDLISFKSDLDAVEIGDSIHLAGTIDKSLIIGSLSDVVILISAPEGSFAETFVLSTPDRTGTFEYTLPADAVGIWGFEALYGGLNSEKVDVKVLPSVKSGKTILTLSGWPLYPHIGEVVSFKGRLAEATGSGVSERNISYEVSSLSDNESGNSSFNTSSVLISSGSTQTDKEGEYVFPLQMNDEGDVLVQAVFYGDEKYLPSKSRMLQITTTDL